MDSFFFYIYNNPSFEDEMRGTIRDQTRLAPGARSSGASPSLGVEESSEETGEDVLS